MSIPPMAGDHVMTFFFAFRSPYAWLAYRLLTDSLSPKDLARIEFVPFWEPQPETLAALQEENGECLYRPMSKQRHLYILQDVKRLATGLSLPFKWPVDGPNVNWEWPHLAYLAADSRESRDRILDVVYQARWELGLNVFDRNSLGEILSREGFGDVAAALDDPAALRAQAVQALLRSYRNRVFGLPYFTVGRDGYWGVDRLPFALAQAGLPLEGIVNAWTAQINASTAEVRVSATEESTPKHEWQTV